MRRIWPAALLTAIAVALSGSGLALAATPRASFTEIENDVMCTVCHESLAVAQAPEAYQERGVIRRLILQGETKKQIEDALVSEYGPAVLAKPPAHGLNLLLYVIPVMLIGLGLITLAVIIPRWRRRARQAPAEPAPPQLALEDAQRLDSDLARNP